MKIRRSLLKDAVAIATYSGDGAYGPVYADAVTVACNIEATRRLVRNAQGDEVVSELTLHVHPHDVDRFLPESQVTVLGRTSTIIAVSPQTLRGSTVYAKVVCS